MAKKVELEEATCKPRIVSFFFLFTVRACFGRLSVDSPSKDRRSKEEKKGEELEWVVAPLDLRKMYFTFWPPPQSQKKIGDPIDYQEPLTIVYGDQKLYSSHQHNILV